MNKTVCILKWQWDDQATYGYNIVAKLEETLIKFGVISDYSDIEPTEIFDKKYSSIPKGAHGEYKRFSGDIKYSTNPHKDSAGKLLGKN